MQHSLSDALICEVVARNGGYEEVDTNSKWPQIAGALGFSKSEASRIKERYEDLLKYTAELEEVEEAEAEGQNYEVEGIVASRVGAHGRTEYLVKWKGFEGDDVGAEAMTWEPRSHLGGAQDAVRLFEQQQNGARQHGAQGGAHGGAHDGAHAHAHAHAHGGGDRAARKREPDDADQLLPAPPSSWRRVTKMKRVEAEAVAPTMFYVEIDDGAEVELTNSQLRDEAPLLLVDFYEARLRML
mmetsp:Transcript_13468/g.28574  ORF Transcript_13468/g.28574 Transcript_13468/m.28574 type:complete len:241 (+) Transcript_13468:293-1015(+)